MQSPLDAAFDPEAFRILGRQVVDLLADRLSSSLRGEGRVRPATGPEAEYQHWKTLMESGTGAAFPFLEEFVARAIYLHHPRYVGHQVCPPAPTAALAGLVAELLNNGMAVYEMGPSATALERWIIEQTAHKIGFEKGAGFLTSGGTLAMLTALLGARARKLGSDSVRAGTEPRWAVITSEEAHYCAGRAVHVMGWGSDGLLRIPVDSRFRIRTDLLDQAHEDAVARGRTPVALVGSACTTSTGSYDDLHALADFCQRRGLWFHVDGAHGAAVAFCEELRPRIAGIERADSVILDFHKLLLTPALATAVLFRDPACSWAAFEQRAQYLWEASHRDEWFNVGRRSFECTKLSMSLKIAALWHAHGEELFAENLRRVHASAALFATLIAQDPRFDLATDPQSNIVCFRLRTPDLSDAHADSLHRGIRTEILEEGGFYLVQTELHARVWLRTALMNPFTKEADLRALLERVVQSATALQNKASA